MQERDGYLRWTLMDSSHVRGNEILLGGSRSGCFARYWPQRNAFLHTEIFFLIASLRSALAAGI
jgi:hypothetical protein